MEKNTLYHSFLNLGPVWLFWQSGIFFEAAIILFQWSSLLFVFVFVKKYCLTNWQIETRIWWWDEQFVPRFFCTSWVPYIDAATLRSPATVSPCRGGAGGGCLVQGERGQLLLQSYRGNKVDSLQGGRRCSCWRATGYHILLHKSKHYLSFSQCTSWS